jgi:hypothetical protein
MNRFKLNLIKCPKCKEKTKVLKNFRSTFLGIKFITTWYKCLSLHCNYTFPRKTTKEKNYGEKIRNMV